MPYTLQTQPFRVPTDDGKVIEEHFGHASTQDGRFSIAHMIAPAGWSEPFQTPEFDEVTYIIQGRKLIEVAEGDSIEKVILVSGQSILIHGGTRVRYSNPFDEPTEYLSVCVPAFSPATVNREG